MTDLADIDWTAQDEFPESNCSCVCWEVFRSHAKFVPDLGLVSRKQCPKCGKHILNRASSDREPFTRIP
jgi:hypothetical protein